MFVGIDIGKGGAVCALNPDNTIHQLFDLPNSNFQTSRITGKTKPVTNAILLGEQLRELPKPDLCIIENIFAPQLISKSSAITLGENQGVVMGVCGALGWNVVAVHPKDWQKCFLWKGVAKDQKKDFYRAEAARQFPDYAESFKRKKDSGRADASLIALSASKGWLSYLRFEPIKSRSR